MSNNFISFFIEPLSNTFFIRGMISAIFVMFGGAILGFGVITRRYSYLGQGVSQSMLAGVAVGILVGASPILAAFLAALLSAVLIAQLSRVRGLGTDASVAIVASSAMSIGVIIISADRSRAVNLNNLLFGNILGVNWSEVVILGGSVLLAIIFTLAQSRKLALSAISPTVAEAHGINIKKIELLRLITLSLVTAAAVQIVGVTLVVAALVIPAASASLLARTLGSFYVIASIFALLIGVLGLYISYWYDLASGPAVVVTGTALYSFVLLINNLRNKS
jgi:iron/zinc/copper transport system permease protein